MGSILQQLCLLTGVPIDEIGFVFGVHDFLAVVETGVAREHVAKGHGE